MGFNLKRALTPPSSAPAIVKAVATPIGKALDYYAAASLTVATGNLTPGLVQKATGLSERESQQLHRGANLVGGVAAGILAAPYVAGVGSTIGAGVWNAGATVAGGLGKLASAGTMALRNYDPAALYRAGQGLPGEIGGFVARSARGIVGALNRGPDVSNDGAAVMKAAGDNTGNSLKEAMDSFLNSGVLRNIVNARPAPLGGASAGGQGGQGGQAGKGGSAAGGTVNLSLGGMGGIDQTTVLMIAAVGLIAVLLLKKT